MFVDTWYQFLWYDMLLDYVFDTWYQLGVALQLFQER